MKRSVTNSPAKLGIKTVLSCFSIYVILIGLTIRFANATENNGSVYPIGAETVMPGITPGPGQTVFAEFNTTYQASSLVNAQGQSTTSGFNLSVYAFAPKVVHNWGVNLLGGTLVSWVATPIADVRMALPSASHEKMGFSNPVFGVADIAYNKGNWHWWYGLDLTMPAPGYNKTDAINIGQHNYATAPVFAFTYLPDRGADEISSRISTSSTTPTPTPTTIPETSWFGNMSGCGILQRGWP